MSNSRENLNFTAIELVIEELERRVASKSRQIGELQAEIVELQSDLSAEKGRSESLARANDSLSTYCRELKGEIKRVLGES